MTIPTQSFQKALKKHGNTAENFFKLLELRFDNVIYRSGIAFSRLQARQLILHGYFTINNHKVNIPSYLLKTGDVIRIKSNTILLQKDRKDLVQANRLS